MKMDVLSLNETWYSTALIALFLGLLFYWYIRPSNSYWADLGVPFVPAKLLVGSLNLFANKPASIIDLDNFKKYGKMYGVYEGTKPVLLLGVPELLRNILVKDFPVFTSRRPFVTGNPISDNMVSAVNGEQWKRLRSIISPTFATGKIKKMTDVILTCAKTVVQNFASKDGKPVEAKELFNTFTMDVIASVAFATKIHSHQDPNNIFLQQANKAFRGGIKYRFVLFVLFPKLAKFLRLNLFDGDVMNFFKEATLEIIRDRRKSGKTGNDFLQMLIDAEKECREQGAAQIPETVEKNLDDKTAEELGHDENNEQIFKTLPKTRFLSEDEMISQCVIFFLGGFDTTASTLGFASHNLALNPEIQDKLSEEVDTVIRNHDGKLTYAAIQDMKYLDNVFSETLRMYPPALRVERMADVDYLLGDTGVTIKKGTIISAPVYAIHHDPEFYPEPEKFNPDRFTTEGKATRHPYSYLPFGAGPRNCVAMRFALMEIKLCLAYLVSQLRIKQCPETEVPLVMANGIGLLQPTGITLCFEKRENRVFDGL